MPGLETSPTPGGYRSAAGRALRVLVIDEECPYPPNAGKRIRSWNLLRGLAHRHAVTLLCYGPVSAEARAQAAANGIALAVCEERITKTGIALYAALFANLFSRDPYSVAKHHTVAFRAQLLQLVRPGRFDLLHCEWGPYAKYLDVTDLPSVVAAHNVEAQIWQRRAENAGDPLSRWFFGLQARRMARFEREQFSKATRTIAVSRPDEDILRAWGVTNTAVVDNGVDVDNFQPQSRDEEQASALLFLASLDWFPNQDSLWYFLAEIFPRVRKQLPEVSLSVAGRRLPPGQAERLRATPGVRFLGEVADVRECYRSAAVVVVPLRIGGGSRLKILEAMAAGKAIVSTTIGAEGLAVVPGQHLIVADEPQAFVDAILALAGDPVRRHQLGQAGRALVEARYSWNSLVDRMDALWCEAAGVKA